jgi:hypothetical protein
MMANTHLEFLVEEPSMETFLNVLFPRLFPNSTFRVHAFQGKPDMLDKLQARLKGYACWPSNYGRIVAVVDCDDDDCHELKQRLEKTATTAGLSTRSGFGGHLWQVVNRIAIEELEAWYFGDWKAVTSAYPRVSPTVPNQAKYRNPDAIKGGTWEAFERILQRGGYFKNGLRKVEVARTIAAHINPNCNRSDSFVKFRNALIEAMA